MFVKDILKDMDTDPLPMRKKFVQMELDMTLAMFRAGVPFLAGTDTAAGVHVFPGYSVHQELALFVQAGLTPLQALQTATLNPAKFLNRLADLGRSSAASLRISYCSTPTRSRTSPTRRKFARSCSRAVISTAPSSIGC